MSFILDALKKSELERQRQSVPGLMDAGATAPRSGFPPWAMAVSVLLAVNLLILAWLLLRPSAPAGAPAPPPTAAVVEPPAAAARTPAAAPASHFSPLDAPPVYAPEIAVPDEAADAGPAAAKSADRPRNAGPVLAPRQAGPVRDDAAEPDEVLPSISELNLAPAQALPELHLDVHVYATSPADRFVYVNMRKYREGAQLQEGPVVERIRRDGVVLNYQGLRFLLPRQ